MRWPLSWLFRAAAETDDRADAGEAPGGSAASPDPAAGAPPGRPDRPAWRDVPPIRTAIGEPPVTAPPGPFEASLAGRHRPAPILEPLGHEVRADGPAGLVGGLASPLVAPAPATPARTSGPPLVPHRAGGRRAAAEDDRVEAPPAAGPGPGQVPRAAELPSAEAAAGPLPDVAPRALPVVAAEMITPALGATAVAVASAPPPVRPLAPLVGTLTPAASAISAGTAGDGPEAAAPALQPRGEGAGPDLAAATAVAPSTRPLPPAALPPARRTLAESRRLGLGAPLAIRPSMQRLSEDARQAAAAASSAGARPALVPLPPARAAGASLPVLPLARAGGAPATAAAPVGSGGTAAAAAGSGSPSRPGPEIAPLIGLEPVVPAPGAGTPAGAIGAAGAPEPGAPEPGAQGVLEGGAPDAGTVVVDAAEAFPVRASPGRALGERAGAAPPSPGMPAVLANAALEIGPEGPVGSMTAPAAQLPRPTVARLAADRAIRASVAPSRGLTAVAPAGPEGRTPAPVVARLLVPPGPTVGGSPEGSPVSRSASLPPSERAAVVGPGGSGPAAGPAPGSSVDVSSIARAPVPVIRLATAVGRAPETPDLPVARLVALPGASRADSSAEAPAAPRREAGGHSIPATAFGPEPAIQRSVEISAVQRAVAIGEVQSEVTPAAGGAAAGAAAGGSEQDLDALAGRLYGRIRDRLADELLADRERAGLIADL